MKDILNRFIGETVFIYPDYYDLGAATLVSVSDDYFTVEYTFKTRHFPYSAVVFLDEEESLEGRPLLGIYIYYKGFKISESNSYF